MANEVETDVVKSPGWWFKVLATQLHDRRLGRSGGKTWKRTTVKPQRLRPPLTLLQDHLAGDPPLLNCAAGWDANFREVVRLGRLNVAALIVEAKSNKMKLRDFRTSAVDDELGDKLAREIMRASNFKVLARDLHDGMLSLADSYAIATPPAKGDKYPLVTAEDATEVITAHDPLTGQVIAALKMFRDEWDAADFAYLYVRDEHLDQPENDGSVRRFMARLESNRSSINQSAFRLSKGWAWDDDLFDLKALADRMPVHRFRNYRGVGEFEPHLATLDRINEKIADIMTISKTQAFRQRAIKGLPDTAVKIVDGQARQVNVDYDGVFEAAPGSLWQVPKDVEFWESQTADFGPIRMAVKDDLEHLAAVTSTSLHTVTPDAASGSAEGASLMRESATDAGETRIDYVDRSHAELMATCFAYMDDPEAKARADATTIEPIWAPIERYSITEKAEAASKAGTSLPKAAIQRDIWQYPPAEIAELRTLEGTDFMFQAPGQPPRPAVPGAAPAPAPAPVPTPPVPTPPTPPGA